MELPTELEGSFIVSPLDTNRWYKTFQT